MNRERASVNQMSKKTRACGTRDQESGYACLPVSDLGYPFEYFYMLPPRKYGGPQLRAPKPVTLKFDNGNGKREEVTHLLLGVGKTHYPTVPSFLEEGKKLGISKKIPLQTLPWEDLDPGRSQVFLIHPRAIPDFDYKVEGECPKEILKRKVQNVGSWMTPEMQETFSYRIAQIKQDIHAKIDRVPDDRDPCLGDLWPLSYLINNHKHQLYKTPEQIPQRVRQDPRVDPEVIEEDERVMVALWGEGDHHILTYTVDKPISWGDVEWKPGIFFHYPLYQIDYVTETGTVPEQIRETIKADKKEWNLRACKE